MKIWHRYLFKQISIVFLFILFSLFTVYLFIDLSVHSVRFFKGDYKIEELILYYIHSFSSLLDLFVPLAFLLASLKVLSDLTTHLELISLQMASLPMKKILVPFFVLATILSGASYANHQWLSPHATSYLLTFKSDHSSKKKKTQPAVVQTTILADNSELVYHRLENNEVSDVFWIRTATDIWHIKTLSFESTPPTARFADHLVAVDGKLIKQESFEQTTFPEMILKGKLEPTLFTPIESLSLSTLLHQSSLKTDSQAKIQTHLHHKLATPLLPILILLATAPFTLIHTRTCRTHLIVALSLIAFIVVLILFDALFVLGTNKIISPWLSMGLVPIIIGTTSSRRFAKI